MALTIYLLAIASAAYLAWRLVNGYRIRYAPSQEQGSIVRYAPGKFSISDPDAIKPITGHGAGFDKASFYEAWAPPGKTSLFKERDNHVHGQLRKRFRAMYSMTSAYTYEKGVAECVELLCQKLEEHAGEEIDLAWWINCFAFDRIGIVTYGKRFDFLDQGRETGNLSKSVHGAFTYGSLMGMYPELHAPFQAASRYITKLTKWNGTGKMYLDSFTGKSVTQRREDRAKDPSIAQIQEGEPTSILDKFLDANENDPIYFTDAHMTMGLGASVTAGSDSTSTALVWALYFLLRNPSTLSRLRSDIDSRGDGRKGQVRSKPSR